MRWALLTLLAGGAAACNSNADCSGTGAYCDNWANPPECKTYRIFTKRGVPCSFPFAWSGNPTNVFQYPDCTGSGVCGTTTHVDGNGNPYIIKTYGECASADFFCSDGKKNAGEVGIDCGGPCSNECPSPTCSDGQRNGGEDGIDCMPVGQGTADCPVCDDYVTGEGEVVATWPPNEGTGSRRRRRLLATESWKNKGSSELSSVQIVVNGEIVPSDGLMTLKRVDTSNGGKDPEEEVTIQAQDEYVQKLYEDQAAFNIKYVQYEHVVDEDGTKKTQLRFALPQEFPKEYDELYTSSDKDPILGQGSGTVDVNNHQWYFEAENTAFVTKARGRPIQVLDPLDSVVKPSATPGTGEKHVDDSVWNFKVVDSGSCEATCENYDGTPYECGNDGCGGLCPETNDRGPFWDGTENEGCGPGRTCDAQQQCKNTVEEDILELQDLLSSLETENQDLVSQLSALLEQLTIISGECGDVSSFGMHDSCANAAALNSKLSELSDLNQDLTTALLALPDLEDLSEEEQDSVTVYQACVGLYDSFLDEFGI